MQVKGRRGETHKSVALQLDCRHTPHKQASFFLLSLVEIGISSVKNWAHAVYALRSPDENQGFHFSRVSALTLAWVPPNMHIKSTKMHPSLPVSHISV